MYLERNIRPLFRSFFLRSVPSFLPSFFPSFLPSFLPSSLPASLPPSLPFLPSFLHSFIHSFFLIHPIFRVFFHSFVGSFVRCEANMAVSGHVPANAAQQAVTPSDSIFIHSLVHLFIRFIHPFIRSIMCLFAHSFVNVIPFSVFHPFVVFVFLFLSNESLCIADEGK